MRCCHIYSCKNKEEQEREKKGGNSSLSVGVLCITRSIFESLVKRKRKKKKRVFFLGWGKSEKPLLTLFAAKLLPAKKLIQSTVRRDTETVLSPCLSLKKKLCVYHFQFVISDF